MSMVSSAIALFERDGRIDIARRFLRSSNGQMLDDEQEQDDAADGNRQISDARGEKRKIGDRVTPRRFAKSGSPDRHEDRHQRHEYLDHVFRNAAKPGRKL